nr:MAG TPA: hypothetical protein [Caudoviricetes sp.]
MRSLKKNKQKLYYATYSDEIPVYETDEDGNIKYIEIDGKMIPIPIGTMAGYNKPVVFYANISAGKGDVQADVFGSSVDYSRTISTCSMDCPITKLTRLWIGCEPQYNEDGSVNGDSANYEVAAPPAKSLNGIVIAIKELPEG